MKDFDAMEEFYRQKEMQGQYKLFEDKGFMRRKEMEHFSKEEREKLNTIPDYAITIIEEFDLFNPRIQTPYAGYYELEVVLPIWSRHMEETLLYALTSGTAYKIANGNIYIWYKPFKGFYGSGFYKLNRFIFLENGRTVKYFLDGNEKLSDSL